MIKQIFLSGCVWLIGCSSTPSDNKSFFRDRDNDYRFAKETNRIVLPDHLADDGIIDRYPVPPLGQADEQFIDGLVMPPAQAMGDKGRVSIQKLNQRKWLLVKAAPSQVWPMLKSYLVENRWLIKSENGQQGLISAVKNNHTIKLTLSQGFQRKTSEISIKQNNKAESISLEQLGQYIVDGLNKPSYSLLATDISTDQSMQVVSDQGKKSIRLFVDTTRAIAATEKALKAASFNIDDKQKTTADSILQLTYMPVKFEKPNFIQRLFGSKHNAIDKTVAYAGKQYRLVIIAEGSDRQHLVLKPIDATTVFSIAENNHIISLLQRHLI